MRVIETTIYRFSELSEEAKEKAIDKWRDNSQGLFSWKNEASDTLNAFCKIFDVKYNTIDYLETYRNKYRINLPDEVKNLSGIRLAAYLWNNYKNELYKGKFYSVRSDKIMNHNRVKSKVLSNGKIFNAYYSAITLEHSCVLTGMCYDDNILDPIYEFMKRPYNTGIDELINDCISSFCKAVASDIEYEYSDKCIIETIEINDYEFTENGDLV